MTSWQCAAGNLRACRCRTSWKRLLSRIFSLTSWGEEEEDDDDDEGQAEERRREVEVDEELLGSHDKRLGDAARRKRGGT